MTALRRASVASWLMLASVPLLAVCAIALIAAGPLLSEPLRWLLLAAIAYLTGAISWGYLFVNLTRGEDVRDFGSGRTGMSNILRTAGGKAASLVFVLDAGKAILVVLLARAMVGSVPAEVIAALAALCGHNWPVYLGFRGGRGIMPGVGGLSIMAPWVALVGCVLFLAVTLSTRYLSLGSIMGTLSIVLASLALTLLGTHHQLYTLYAGLGGAMIIWQHRDNIRRILSGTERRLGAPGLRNR